MKKKQSRRQFVGTSIKAGATLPFLGYPFIACNNSTDEQKTKEISNSKKLNILILGGTSFLGPHQIAYAMGRGHSITTFTRGKTKQVYTKSYLIMLRPLLAIVPIIWRPFAIENGMLSLIILVVMYPGPGPQQNF